RCEETAFPDPLGHWTCTLRPLSCAIKQISPAPRQRMGALAQDAPGLADKESVHEAAQSAPHYGPHARPHRPPPGLCRLVLRQPLPPPGAAPPGPAQPRPRPRNRDDGRRLALSPRPAGPLARPDPSALISAACDLAAVARPQAAKL